MTTSKMEKKPAVVLDATPKDESETAPPVDPTQCQCTGVERRWDTDGLVEKGRYCCSVCGKWYA